MLVPVRARTPLPALVRPRVVPPSPILPEIVSVLVATPTLEGPVSVTGPDMVSPCVPT